MHQKTKLKNLCFSIIKFFTGTRSRSNSVSLFSYSSAIFKVIQFLHSSIRSLDGVGGSKADKTSILSKLKNRLSGAQVWYNLNFDRFYECFKTLWMQWWRQRVDFIVLTKLHIWRLRRLQRPQVTKCIYATTEWLQI